MRSSFRDVRSANANMCDRQVLDIEGWISATRTSKPSDARNQASPGESLVLFAHFGYGRVFKKSETLDIGKQSQLLQWRHEAEKREHSAVESLRRYVIIETASVGLTVHERQAAGQQWTVMTVMAGDVLSLPGIDVEVPIAELYDGVDFPPIASEA